MAVFTAIATAITSALVATGVGAFVTAAGAATLLATTLGYVGAAVIFGGVALLSTSLAKKSGDYGANSATYSSGILQTQTNQDLPIPLLYGTVKLAGNRIWQDEDGTKNVKRIVAFAEGEITDFTDIRLNDIKSTEVKGIKINKYLGTSTQVCDEIVGGNNQNERVEKVGSLRNLAYLAIDVPRSDDIDINYNLTSVVKGRKIRVYTTPTKYTIQYSENPAWVMLDFLTSYNGLGLVLNNDGTINDSMIAELFDMQSFIESASFCDEKISYIDNDGNTKTTPRFTFNMIFDAQTSARDLIDEIYRSCRGGLFTKNGKLQFKIDKAEPVSKVFTAEDIVKGSETFNTLPTEEHYDILKLVYISPEHEWQKVEAFAEIPNYRDGVPVEHSINCYSITNFQQASRLAWYYVNSKRLCPYFGSFKTDYRAYDLEVGDVIKFDSLLMGLTGYLAKITSVIDDGAGTFTINWRTYDERLYSDELGSKETRVLVSKLSDKYIPPDNVLNFNVIQSQNYFNFVWQYNQNKQDTYEIRYGESWEYGIVIGKNISANNFSWKIPSRGLYKFWIKAFNNYQYSKNATLDIYSVDSIPTMNEVVKLNILENCLGEFVNTYSYQNTIKLNVDNVLWQNTQNYWGNDTYYQNATIWGANVVTNGQYISQIYDIGSNLKSIVSFNSQYFCTDKTQEIILEWRYSSDNENWAEWCICNNGEYKFRYCQFRANFYAYNHIQMLLKTFDVCIDVPDKETELDVEVPISGILTIDYDFINIPSIIGTVNDDVNAYVVIKSKTNSKATIQTLLNDGTPTAAKVNLRLKGY